MQICPILPKEPIQLIFDALLFTAYLPDRDGYPEVSSK